MKGLVSCDWLALSCMLGQPKPRASVPDGWRMEYQSATAVWNIREYLFDERGAKVATFLRYPKSSIMDARRMVIEVANEWLYNSLIISKIETILEIYPCVVTGMPRFDICLDAELTQEAEQVLLGLVNGDVYKSGSQQGAVWFTTKRATSYPHQISWGAPESTFHWKFYNKHKELYSEGYCSKPYIVERWKALGMKETRVWRLECSVSDSPKLKVKDGEVERKLTWNDVIERRVPLYLDLYNNRFVLRRNEGHSNKTRDSRVWLWGVDEMQTLIGYEEKKSQRSTDSERRLLRKLYQEYCKVDRSSVVINVLEDSIGTLLQNHSLLSMYMQMSGLTEREVHMRFPKSLQVLSEASNWLQYDIPFGQHEPYDRVLYPDGCGPKQLLPRDVVTYPNGCGPSPNQSTFRQLTGQTKIKLII